MTNKIVVIALLLGSNAVRAGSESILDSSLNQSVQRSLEVQAMQDSTDRRRQIAQEYFSKLQAKKLYGSESREAQEKNNIVVALKQIKTQVKN